LEVATTKKISLVAGSTGLIGNLLIEELAKSGKEVIAISRNKKISEDKGISNKVIDFEDKESLDGLFTNINDVFICLGTTIKKAGSKEKFRKVDVDYCFSIAEAASKAKVPNLSIVTSIGADSESHNFYLKCKGEVEEMISDLCFKSLSIYRPSLLIGNREEKRLAESIGQVIQPRLIDPLLRGSSLKYHSVKAVDLAYTLQKLSGVKEGKKIYQFEDFKTKGTS
tara:strand:- start:29 stop:703 length:675 start_codon:yes stop_codon:yes gene_type:complete